MRAAIALFVLCGCLDGGSDPPPKTPEECFAVGGKLSTRSDGVTVCTLPPSGAFAAEKNTRVSMSDGGAD